MQDQFKMSKRELGRLSRTFGTHFAIWLWKISWKVYEPVGVIVVVLCWIYFSLLMGNSIIYLKKWYFALNIKIIWYNILNIKLKILYMPIILFSKINKVIQKVNKTGQIKHSMRTVRCGVRGRALASHTDVRGFEPPYGGRLSSLTCWQL